MKLAEYLVQHSFRDFKLGVPLSQQSEEGLEFYNTLIYYRNSLVATINEADTALPSDCLEYI